MTTLVTRAGKGSPLTNTEMDANLTNLNAAVTTATGEGALTGFYYPAAGSAYQDCYRAGFLPSWFNQQWGGAQWGTLPDGSFGSVATGSIEDNGTASVSAAAGNYYISQGFKVSESFTLDSIWVKLYKVGNPTYNLTARIYSDTASSPNAAIGSAATISAKLFTSKTDGEWYQITGLAAALTAGTQYHIVLSSLAAVDASNYVVWKVSSGSKKYPHGNYNTGTSVPAWTPTTTTANCFLIQNPAANSLIQSGGMFDYKLSFAPGTPVNQSRSVAQPLANFYDGKTCSVLYRGTFAISTNVWDFTYGLDHDRITLTINSSGYPVLSIYESDRTVATVTGTGSVASGNHDVGIRVRTMADGADYATLYVDGVSVGTPLTAQTFTMAAEMVRLGAARLGDGFGLIPTWTQDMQMTSLPSAQGWTWTGTATEANAMSVSGGKLYQNANGYASTDTGDYSKTVVLNNTTGWTVSTKVRVPIYASTSVTSSAVWLQIVDGTKRFDITITEYWLSAYGGAYTYIQSDFKSQDRVITACGKGSDYYVFIDGKLTIDGTGGLTAASGSNQIAFGDTDAVASANADAIWSYVKYYQGGMLLPTAGSNTCSEFAHWSGDKSALFPSLYNSGTPVSVKQLCGVPRNYQFEQVVQREVRRLISTSTTSSSSDAVLTDSDSYVIGSDLNIASDIRASHSAANGQFVTNNRVDGVAISSPNFAVSNATAGFPVMISRNLSFKPPLGLHKVDATLLTPSGATLSVDRGETRVEARS